MAQHPCLDAALARGVGLRAAGVDHEEPANHGQRSRAGGPARVFVRHFFESYSGCPAVPAQVVAQVVGMILAAVLLLRTDPTWAEPPMVERLAPGEADIPSRLAL